MISKLISKGLGLFGGWTPVMFWIRGALLSMILGWVWYTLHLQNKVDDLNIIQGEHSAAIDICELSKIGLRDEITKLSLSVDVYKGSWEEQKEKSKDAADIIAALNTHTQTLIDDLSSNRPTFETCEESINWMLETRLGDDTNE